MGKQFSINKDTYRKPSEFVETKLEYNVGIKSNNQSVTPQFFFTQIMSPTCDEILNPYICHKSQTWSGNLLWISILHEKT